MTPSEINGMAEEAKRLVYAFGVERRRCRPAKEERAELHAAIDRLRDAALSTLPASAGELPRFSVQCCDGRLRDALEAYADPSFYHACAFMFDRPAGGFDEDFSFDEEYGRAMPGKLARETLAAEVTSAAPVPTESIDRKINRRNAERLLDELMAKCEAIGYEKGLAATPPQAAVPAALSTPEPPSAAPVLSPYDTADYLRSDEEALLYLKEAIIAEAGDDGSFVAEALGNVARAKVMMATIAGETLAATHEARHAAPDEAAMRLEAHEGGVTAMAEQLRSILDGRPCIASEPPELAEVAVRLAAAPVPAERWLIVRESALDVGLGDDVRTGGRPALGYAVLAHAKTFASEDEARAALQAHDLPLGWVLMPLSRLLPDLAATPPQTASPPAEPTRSQKLRDAGFTPRERLTGAGGLMRDRFKDDDPDPGKHS